MPHLHSPSAPRPARRRERSGVTYRGTVLRTEHVSPHMVRGVLGEAGFVKELRRVLRVERALPLDRLSVSGYRPLGHDEDGWQCSKREWNRQVEAEQDADTRTAS